MFITQKSASQVVAAVLAGRNLSDTLTQQWALNRALSPQQKGAIQDISYGSLRHLGLLEEILKNLLRAPLHEAELRALLITSLYQLQFTRAAPYSIVDHAVKVAAHTGSGKGKGLVNGVLRNFLRNQEELIRQAQSTESGRYSHPSWWINAMREAYPQQWQGILESNNQHPPMTLRVNRRHCSTRNYLAVLTQAGIKASIIGNEAILLEQPIHVEKLPNFTQGWVSVQDMGAQQAALLLDLSSGQRVLDACAAPGGKSCHIMELADVDLLAIDSDAQRLQRVEQNLTRLGLKARVAVGDANHPEQWWDGQYFDRILADVPCSATGVTRRHPDIKWLRRPQDFADFARQQAKMIDALWPLLAKGGKLLYATCSVFPAENVATANAFAERHPDAERLALSAAVPDTGQLLPTLEHDGFYYALFCKRG